MTVEIITVEILPLNTAIQPSKHCFLEARKHLKLSPMGYCCLSRALSLNQAINSAPLRTLPKHWGQFYSKRKLSVTCLSLVPKTRTENSVMSGLLHKLITFASASNSWWDHSLDCQEVKILPINILKLLDHKGQSISWQSPGLPMTDFTLLSLSIPASCQEGWYILGYSWDLYTKSKGNTTITFNGLGFWSILSQYLVLSVTAFGSCQNCHRSYSFCRMAIWSNVTTCKRWNYFFSC